MSATQTAAPVPALSIAAMRRELWAMRARRAPMKERAALVVQLEAAEREQGPEMPPAPFYRVCCPRAVVSHDCTCGHVTMCDVHGKQCHGSHD